METIESLVNEIEGEVLRAKKAAFSSTDIVVNRQTMLALISRFRGAYPIALREAEQIKRERDDILSKANAYAESICDNAEAQVAQMKSDTEIMRQAREDADALRREAQEAYDKMDYEARALAFNLLDGAEKALKESRNIINGRKRKLVEE
jgi:cell division septum initiation protein DivIVA